MKIRLLTAITLSKSGGSQRVVFDLLTHLPENRYDITLMTAPGGELVRWLDENNQHRENKIKVIEAPCFRRELSPLNDLKAFALLFTRMVGHQFDIAHFHNSKMGILGRLAARLAGVPAIYYTVHGWGMNPQTGGRLFRAMCMMERVAARAGTEVVFVSRADRETGMKNRWADASAARLIPNGIADDCSGCAHVRSSLGIAPDLPVIVFVARLAEPKEPLFAMRVSARLLQMGAEHRLLIVGDGPLRQACETLVREQGSLCRTVLLGHREDARAILNEADIFCLFTRWEGLPVSIIEAMFAGLPVVASAVGGVPELVRHGETGTLLNGFDCEQAAHALLRLMENRALRLRMGRASRETALREYTLEGMVAGYRRLYEEQKRLEHVPRRSAWPSRHSVGQRG